MSSIRTHAPIGGPPHQPDGSSRRARICCARDASSELVAQRTSPPLYNGLKKVAQNPNPQSDSITYADAGVSIDRGNRTKQRIKYLAHKTFTKGVLSEIGGFGGLFALDKKYLDPVLVSSVDGVGTKLKVAFDMKMHHTVGADLVNHCVNDIAVQGATPLFFMDYLATGTLDPEVAEK